jgi:hypothetical protein
MPVRENTAVPTPASWNGRVFLDAGRFLYLGPGATAGVHAHHAVQLVWGRDDAVTANVDGRAVRGPGDRALPHRRRSRERRGVG